MTAALPDAKKIKGPEAPAGRSPGLALELLVHGVGGATPAGMLQDPRTVCLQGDDTAGIHRRAHDADAEQRPGDYQGKTVPEVRALVRRFKGMMSIETDADADGDIADADVPLGDLEALQGVVKFPVRIKCATLAWNTLTQALDTPA